MCTCFAPVLDMAQSGTGTVSTARASWVVWPALVQRPCWVSSIHALCGTPAVDFERLPSQHRRFHSLQQWFLSVQCCVVVCRTSRLSDDALSGGRSAARVHLRLEVGVMTAVAR